MIKSIVFDIDGTMLNSEYADLRSFQETIFELKNEYVEMSELTFALGIPGKVALEQVGISDTENGNRIWNSHMAKYAHTMKLFDDIEQVIKELKMRGYKLGIITSKNRKEYTHDFTPFGLSNYFDTVICVEDSGRPKPSPDPMLKYLEVSGTSRDSIIYIGDTIYDMQCASAAGVRFGLAVWGSHVAGQVKADYYFNTPKDILPVLCKD